MIFDATANLVVGNMGWVDKGALWAFDPVRCAETTITVEGAQYLSLRAGAKGLFRLVHHRSPNQTISIRSVARPDVELASVEMVRSEPNFIGDLSFWQHVDPAAIIATERGQRLVLIDAGRQRVVDLELALYSNGNYDLGYQGLTDCMTIGREHVIVSVQRSSELVVIDLDRNARVGAIPLAGRGGNPMLSKRTQRDFLASDYDTLCRVDAQSLKALNCRRLQEGSAMNSRQFIGDYDLGWDSCVVARPFSGDVLRLDSESFDEIGGTSVSGQPLAICSISNTQVVTRDWKSGRAAVSEL